MGVDVPIGIMVCSLQHMGLRSPHLCKHTLIFAFQAVGSAVSSTVLCPRLTYPPPGLPIKLLTLGSRAIIIIYSASILLHLLSLSMIDAVAELVLGCTLPREGFCSVIVNSSVSSMSWSSTTGTVT